MSDNKYKQEVYYNLLKMLSQNPRLSQRDMAKDMGVSLGKINYCISELTSKGWIKIIQFKSIKNKSSYTYILTPKGIEEKAILTINFLKRKIKEYEEIKKQIRDLHDEVEKGDLANLSSRSSK